MLRTCVLLALVLAACGEPGTSPDAGAVDARPDAVVETGDAGPCVSGRPVTGALVDLDSTTSQFLGVAGARFTLQGSPDVTSTTAPNGRFELCAPAAAAYVLDVEAPADHLVEHAYIADPALSGFYPLELRAFTRARAEDFYAEHGLVFDAARAHVLVFQNGDRVELTLDRAHGVAHAADGDEPGGELSWGAGTAGRYVLFPNVDASAPTAQLHGGPGAPDVVPLAAGKLTVAATFFVYL